MKILHTVISLLLPIFMLTGFSSSSGIYMITPIQEREDNLRQMLTLSGMRSSSYYLGLFLADFLLFLIPCALFIAFVLCFNMKTYTKDLPDFIAIMVAFGMALITFTYFFASLFDS